MSTATDERDTTLELDIADLYVGAGNWITYYSETHGLQRHMAVAQDDRRVEVAFTGRDYVRSFAWIDKLSIVTVNDQRVKITDEKPSSEHCPLHGVDCPVWVTL